MTFQHLTFISISLIIILNAYTVLDGEYLFRVSRCKRCRSLDARIITWYDRLAMLLKDSSTAIGVGLFYLAGGVFTIWMYGYILILLAISVVRACDGELAAEISMHVAFRLLVSPYAAVWLLPLLVYLDR